MSDIAFKVLIGNGYDDVLFKTIMLKGEKGDQGEAGGALIDDTTTSTETTWSSNKINSEISAKPSAFSQLSDVAIVNISDGQMAVYDFTTGKWKNQNVDASTLKYNSVKTIKDELDAKASSLTDLDDVNITNPQNDQGMIYDSTTGKWKNGNPAVSGDLDDLDDVQIDLNTLADGQGVKWDAQNNKWVNGAVSATTALANLTDVALDSSIPDSSSLVYNATEGKWENEQLNATLLPIQSGSATNTKDYIVTGLSGKADSSAVNTAFATIGDIKVSTLSAGNKTIGDIQNWAKSEGKGLFWGTAYMTSPFSGWGVYWVYNRIVASAYSEIIIIQNDHIITSFTSSLDSTTPTWTTKSGSLA